MKIAIIGWWAAGMMAAATIAEHSDHEIHIFEKNNILWAKVIISWWWRCNITTWYFKKQDLQNKYIRGWDFLQHAMWQFWPRKMYQRVEAHGVPLKCEDDMRVFPVSNNGKDVVWMFEHIFREKKVQIHFKEWVDTLAHTQWMFVITTNQWTYKFDKVIITTGGNAYAHTWSSGDGYDLAKPLWHTTTPLWPSLNSFLIVEERPKLLSWISFSNAKITHEKTEVIWPALLTHFGISWPAVFAFSSHTSFEPINKEIPLHIRFAPFAEINQEKWTTMLTKYAHTQPKKQLDTILNYHFPDRFVQGLLQHIGIIHTRNIADLTREEKATIAQTLGEGIQLTLIARRPGDEFVTAWWINTDEVNKKTMESLICPWLYFWGEVLNVDWVTWGYNLQACWSTGYAAGIAIASQSTD